MLLYLNNIVTHKFITLAKHTGLSAKLCFSGSALASIPDTSRPQTFAHYSNKQDKLM